MKFGPDFESVSSKYRSQADFQRLNGDDPGSSTLMQKYGVNSYPRIIFTDSSGVKLDEARGAPGRAQFEQMVQKFVVR